jgi:hypothetical protein
LIEETIMLTVAAAMRRYRQAFAATPHQLDAAFTPPSNIISATTIAAILPLPRRHFILLSTVIRGVDSAPAMSMPMPDVIRRAATLILRRAKITR